MFFQFVFSQSGLWTAAVRSLRILPLVSLGFHLSTEKISFSAPKEDPAKKATQTKKTPHPVKPQISPFEKSKREAQSKKDKERFTAQKVNLIAPGSQQAPSLKYPKKEQKETRNQTLQTSNGGNVNEKRVNNNGSSKTKTGEGLVSSPQKSQSHSNREDQSKSKPSQTPIKASIPGSSSGSNLLCGQWKDIFHQIKKYEKQSKCAQTDPLRIKVNHTPELFNFYSTLSELFSYPLSVSLKSDPEEVGTRIITVKNHAYDEARIRTRVPKHSLFSDIPEDGVNTEILNELVMQSHRNAATFGESSVLDVLSRPGKKEQISVRKIQLGCSHSLEEAAEDLHQKMDAILREQKYASTPPFFAVIPAFYQAFVIGLDSRCSFKLNDLLQCKRGETTLFSLLNENYLIKSRIFDQSLNEAYFFVQNNHRFLLDLHGISQEADAIAQTEHFLKHHFLNFSPHGLVMTGKGSVHQGKKSGLFIRNLPTWMDQSPMAPFITSTQMVKEGSLTDSTYQIRFTPAKTLEMDEGPISPQVQKIMSLMAQASDEGNPRIEILFPRSLSKSKVDQLHQAVQTELFIALHRPKTVADYVLTDFISFRFSGSSMYIFLDDPFTKKLFPNSERVRATFGLSPPNIFQAIESKIASLKWDPKRSRAYVNTHPLGSPSRQIAERILKKSRLINDRLFTLPVEDEGEDEMENGKEEKWSEL